ncbi:hypothetical protein R1flu_010141 [Riccia fluitans]|uniref:Uncharacterized protein n=1 Tax=Riccia fluitans TaxID=41844 RepID=A0ABD1Z461_9MARC
MQRQLQPPNSTELAKSRLAGSWNFRRQESQKHRKWREPPRLLVGDCCDPGRSSEGGRFNLLLGCVVAGVGGRAPGGRFNLSLGCGFPILGDDAI